MNPTTNKNSAKRTKKPSSMRIGLRYRENRVKGNFDAIVIGSGIGGLTTATSLAKMGKKVLVLEQHYTAGGFTHAYSREGYEWDVGVHYIGDVGYPTISRKLFDFVSNQKLKWAAMDKVYDRIFIGEKSYDLVAGKKAFIDEFKKNFPDDHVAIDQYLKRIKRVNKGMQWFTISKLLSVKTQKLIAPLINRLLPKYFNKTTYEVLREITDNEKLIAVLTGQWGDSGVPPKTGSFLIHSLIVKHYINGGYYPVGGASKIAESIIPQIQASGGEVFTYAKVEEIVVENNRAIGVRMADGNQIFAPIIVSNAGVLNTFNKLLPRSLTTHYQYDQKIQHIKPSCTNVGLFIGLKEEAKSLGLPKTNFWIYPDEFHDKNVSDFFDDHTKPFPAVYISFPSAKDPSFLTRYPGRATIEIVAPANYESFAQWKETIWGKRGDDYDKFIQYFSDRMLQVLYEKLPQLKGKIDYYEASSPLSTKYFCAYDKGEIYGLEHDPQRFKQFWLKPKTQIPGLWLTGQDVLSCGVAGAMIAGFLTATQILGWRKGIKLARIALANRKPPEEGWIISEPSHANVSIVKKLT